MPPVNLRTIAIANALLSIVGTAVHADEIEGNDRVLLSDLLTIPTPIDENELDRSKANFGIRKGRGIQYVKPIEVNDQKYELNVSGPIVKSGTKKKSFGLAFEVRF